MTEVEKIISLFEKLYNGEPWIDVNIKSILENITAKQADSKPFPNCNSIWEIVNHLIEWRTNVLQRLQGVVIVTPGNNYFEPIEDKSNQAWKDILKKFEDSQTQWIVFLKQFNPESFDSRYPSNKMTYYEHIQGILQHDSYHLGQIVLLIKVLEI
ncbi:MAG: DinB family protein [Ferruginibacter sp.]